MKVSVVSDGNFLPKEIADKTIDIIRESLKGITTINGKFEINDTLYYREQRTGRITTCVMNSANYISSKFQANLASIEGCSGETKIGNQRIDGFCRFAYSGTGFNIVAKDKLLAVLHQYIRESNLSPSTIYTLFPMFYGMFAENRSLYRIDEIPQRCKKLFESKQVEEDFRLGVEFETGNVASSFRAINKLFVLFQQGEIDAGVFVTCTDKPSAATRIWPVSNRNGSFQELERRNYQEQVSLPLICIGFSPDSFSSEAPFLGKDGSLYEPTDTTRVHASGNYKIMLGEDNEELLFPN